MTDTLRQRLDEVGVTWDEWCTLQQLTRGAKGAWHGDLEPAEALAQLDDKWSSMPEQLEAAKTCLAHVLQLYVRGVW